MMTKVLFVCHGNICRSPMAEYRLRALAREAGLQARITAASAATSAEELGNPVYPPARRKLAEHGIACAEHAARQLQRADYDRYDLLIAMDEENLAGMRRICGGDPAGKMRLLLSYTDTPRAVADPWYTGDFEAAWQDIDRGCRALLAALTEP